MDEKTRWYCIRTKANQEQTVGARLDQWGIPSYVPLMWADKRLARKHQQPFESLLPGYAFFQRINGLEFRDVFNSPGVLDILRLTFDKDGTRWPTPMDADVQALWELEGQQGIREIKHDYQKGDRVRITNSEAFRELEAIVDMAAQDRVYVWLEFLGKRQRVNFGREQVEPA